MTHGTTLISQQMLSSVAVDKHYYLMGSNEDKNKVQERNCGQEVDRLSSAGNASEEEIAAVEPELLFCHKI